jgi:hypothetical protein
VFRKVINVRLLSKEIVFKTLAVEKEKRLRTELRACQNLPHIETKVNKRLCPKS